MNSYKQADVLITQVFYKYHTYKRMLKVLNDDFNDFPYQSGNLVQEKGSSVPYSIPTRVTLEDEYGGYIRLVEYIIASLDEESKSVLMNTYVLRKRKWWNDAYMSDATYYRKRKKAIISFCELYNALKKD